MLSELQNASFALVNIRKARQAHMYISTQMRLLGIRWCGDPAQNQRGHLVEDDLDSS